jgi:hypothetical protein
MLERALEKEVGDTIQHFASLFYKKENGSRKDLMKRKLGL